MSPNRQSVILIPTALAAVILLSGCDNNKRDPRYAASRQVIEKLGSKLSQSASGGAGGPTQDPDGFATLTGVIKIQGSPPQLAAIAVSGDDAAVCAPGGQLPPNESVVVAKQGGGLANVLLYLDMKVPESWAEHPDHAARKNAVLKGPEGFDQKQCRFLSHVFAMRSTQTVMLINSDPVGHNTSIQPTKGATAQNKTLPAGASAPYNPGGATNGAFPVTCAIHPWMKAYMATFDHPYFAVSAETDGGFEIKNLPSGVDLRLRAWHEQAGYLKPVKVTVNGNADATPWKKGRYKTKLQNGQPMKMEIVIDAADLQ